MNLGGLEALAQEIAGQAILDHAKETESRLVRQRMLLMSLVWGIRLAGTVSDQQLIANKLDFGAVCSQLAHFLHNRMQS
jgi:hypothetical protein